MAAPDEREFPREYSVYLAPVQDGEARTRNPHPDYIQRENIHQSSEDSNFEVVVNLLSCIHGTLDDKEKIPASLIIFEFFYFIKSGSARVRGANFRLDFFNKDPHKQQNGPSIVAWAPYRFEERSNVSSGQAEIMKQLEAKLGAEYMIQAGLSATWAKKLGYQERFSERGVAVRRPDYYGTRFPTVKWTLHESKKPGQKDGLPANFRAAVLLQRPVECAEERFVGVLSMDFDTGKWNKATKDFGDWRKNTIPDDPVNFCPKQPAFNNFASIDPTNLGKYAKDTSLRVLTVIPGLEAFEPAVAAPTK